MPNQKLDVTDGVDTTFTGLPTNIAVTNTGTIAAGLGAGICFRANYDNTISTIYGIISGGRENSTISNTAGYLAFGTRDSGAGTSIERMRLTSTGRLGIGTTSPSASLAVYAPGTPLVDLYDSTNLAELTVDSVATNVIRVATGTGDSLALCTNGSSEKARLTSDGKFLIGTSTAPSAGDGQYGKLIVQGYTGDNTAQAYFSLQRGGVATSITSGQGIATIGFNSSDGYPFAAINALADANAGSGSYPGRLTFSTTASGSASPTERVRLNSNGQLFVNQTSNISGTGSNVLFQVTGGYADYAAAFANTNGDPYGIYIKYTGVSPNGLGNSFLLCYDSGSTLRASIRSNGGLANYSANNANLSDINAKKDISPAADTWNCLKEWEIVNYRYKDQPDDADLNLGVIAQQVAESCPEVITIFQEAKEATDDAPAQDERLGVKEQQMYWMAIKALQEAQVRIEQLESKVAALEGA